MAGRPSLSPGIIRRVGLLALAACMTGGGLMILRGRVKRSTQPIPTAEVRQGEFVDFLQLRGEVRARVSTIVTAPFNAGDLQIVKLCPNGAQTEKGDVVVQFDTMTLQRTIDQNRSAVKQAEAEIDRLKAQQRIREEQNLTALMKVRYDIERARLDLGREEVLAAIEVEKARLGMGKAEQKMREVEARLAADRVGAEADLAAAGQKLIKARSDLETSERNMAALTLTTPIGGIATLMPNFRARTGFGSTAPPFKEGDRAWPGAAIVELPDLATIQVNAPVDESERGRLELEQPVSVRIDAVPDREHTGVVDAISPLAKLDYSSWPVKKNFDLTVRLSKPDPRLRPGMSATARVAVERLPDSILVPADAVFEKGGRAICYVERGDRFEEQSVEVGRRGDGQAVVSRGLRPGWRVALKDPAMGAGRK